MALYFISYDLRRKRDYATLYKELQNFNAVQVLESTWCFNRYNTTTAGLRDYFKTFIDSDDGICITEIQSWASWNALKSPKDLK
jgi:hypothetical protein